MAADLAFSVKQSQTEVCEASGQSWVLVRRVNKAFRQHMGAMAMQQ